MVRVLVVSAEDRTRATLEDWLATRERRVVGVRDIREGVAEVLDGEADVAFVDVDGQEAACARAVRVIRRARPWLPVVVLSKDTGQGSLGAIPGTGVFCTMVKPIDRLEVEEVATSAVRHVTTDGRAQGAPGTWRNRCVCPSG